MAQIAVGLLKPTLGEVLLDGVPMSQLLAQYDKSWRRRVQMAFQDTGSSLNPRKTVARCLTETLKLRGVPKADRHREAVEILRLVGLEESIMGRLPHELSGGQRQRVGIARALAMKPKILIADEPVSALDVSLQAQVVNLLIRLTDELGLTLVFISHDLALVRSLCSRVVVMRAGRIVEEGPALRVLDHPEHHTRSCSARRSRKAMPAAQPHLQRKHNRPLLIQRLADPHERMNSCRIAIKSVSISEAPSPTSWLSGMTG